jgi:EpsI family protein
MIKKSHFVIVYILLAAAGLYVNFHDDITVPVKRSFEEFPLSVHGWRVVSQDRFSERVLDILKPTDYLSRTYAGSDGRPINLYIGYHGGGREGGGVHSPKHCLPGSGWSEASSKRTRLAVGGTYINLIEAVYQKGEERELFFYWFQVRDKTLSDEYSLKLSEITGSMLYRRTDASFVRISVPVQGSLEQSVADGERFVKDLYPVILQFLPS